MKRVSIPGALTLALVACSPPPAVCPEPASAAPVASAAPLPTTASAVALDLPRAQDWQATQVVLAVDLSVDGTRSIDGKLAMDDGEMLARAREVVARIPDVRAVVRADAQVVHGRVIHALDLLKQAGISKIAFGVTVAPSPSPSPSPSPPAPTPAVQAGVRAGQSWSCPFPAAADAAKVDRGVVVLQVNVDAAGNALSTNVLSDPGYGFGGAAATCALSRKYEPARDRQGNPTPGVTPPIRVTFSR